MTITADYNNKEVKFYLDGSLRYTYNAPGTMVPNLYYDNLQLGSYSTSPYATWKGNMDEFSIWNTILTQDEITYLYNKGLGKAPL